MGSPHFPDLQKKVDCSMFEESNGKEEHKGLNQEFSLYFPPVEIKRFTFSSEFCEGNEEQLQHSQLEQQIKEVLFHDFEDPIADFLDSISSMNAKIVLSIEDCLHRSFKPLFCMIWLPLCFGERSSTMSINYSLTWLHWKSSFT